MKINVAYFYEFQKMYLYKDIFLMPYYLSKHQHTDLEFCYSHFMGGEELPDVYRGAKIKGDHRASSTKLQRLCDMFRYIVFRARKIRSLFVVGFHIPTILVVMIYKTLNPSGNVIVFGDVEPAMAQRLEKGDMILSKGMKAWIKKYLYDYYFSRVIYVVPAPYSYSAIKKVFDRKGWRGLVNIYPCLDDDMFDLLQLQHRQFDEKDDIILYVGRIGNYQKNTDMMLEAFKLVNFRDWRVYMVGPITESFSLDNQSGYESVITKFFEENPQLKEHVFFTGPIYEQKLIFDYYLRSKIFLLTSRHEGFGNVQSEAAALGCYTVSTDVGGAPLVTNNWQFGKKVEQEDSVGLATVIQEIVDGKLAIDPSKRLPIEKLKWNTIVEDKLMPLMT